MNYGIENFFTNGFSIISDFLTNEEVLYYRNILDIYLSNNNYYGDSISRIIPGFAGRTKELEELNLLHEKPSLIKIVSNIFQNKNFIFLDHSDLHQNKTTGWHRDTKDYERGGGKIDDIWSEECLIIKVSFLLQDHLDNSYGLWFKPGTHKLDLKLDPPPVHAYTKSTDMIIFDQRIQHRGQVNKPLYHEKYKQHRYLITYGFGLDNNYSLIHIKGSSKRQNEQRLKGNIL